ncbi:fimbria/pilus periplasmic chaperone [Vibrio sp. V26_P1S5P106]|uniref:fimbrial biogenesis chaperone n=1 Tax=unclassified Vibrio TaxID=2614977 RepID=UPI0013733D68|nr:MULTISPECIES: molecular chaperone [unclassified Vibrio]NAW70374.1 fimbria/pilus periplasmic chaperone [Vibrio sp. V28_P6S34P95]NAX04647.1 fimbria/pilus periplasmic chaperone [Vibrio sp. V30_P3S12P165]NAX35528.1 fimbria/pilus periplasmic chaperone [Vibrio sp. V29_P1S30P107]NAX39601.1 fimbria/pilus periplasmic chaperone [Vibrio sp. V26_P1S5P106]
MRNFLVFLWSYMLTTPLVFASVVLTNTRVIYPADSKEHTIQFTNTDQFPNIVQLWIDTGDAQSTPETADGPFVVLPPVFKVNADSGQSVRIIYTGQQLPQDRESVFYLNFLVIPPKMDKAQEQNQLLIVLRNRVKLFYRPTTIDGSASKSIAKMSATLTYTKNGDPETVTLLNQSGYFISLSNLHLDFGATRYNFGPVMIAPYDELSINHYLRKESMSGNLASQNSGAVLRYAYVNDYGAHIVGSFTVNYPYEKQL